MKEFINYTYIIQTSFCSDFMLVPKYELGVSNESNEDIYNVYAIGDTDENNVDFLKLRTRYYFTSLQDKENFLFCYFESQVYLSPNANPFASDKNFVEMVLQQHDSFALDCLNGKEIDTHNNNNKFKYFEKGNSLELNIHSGPKETNWRVIYGSNRLCCSSCCDDAVNYV